MGRPPLQEMPLEQFMPLPRNNKRPLSPGDTFIVSPAKRPNLSTQAIFSPERPFKSPLSSSRTGYGSPMRFSDVLEGASSPARKLDFGIPKHLAGDPQKRSLSDPLQRPSSSRLAPSPELKPRVVRTPRSNQQDSPNDLFFDDASSSVTPPPSTESSFILIPRDLPPRSDPHSVHFPGFVVYQDPHLVTCPSWSMETVPATEDEECYKENVRVSIEVTKCAPILNSSSLYKGGLKSDFVGISKFKPACGSSGRHSNPNPKSHSARTTGTPMQAMKQSRRLLQDELDMEEDADVTFE